MMGRMTKEEAEAKKRREAEFEERMKKRNDVTARLRDEYPLIDLTPIARDASICRTYVRLKTRVYDGPSLIDWIISGGASLDFREQIDTWVLSSRIRDGATDFEHDSAYAFQLGLVGLTFKTVMNNLSIFTAFISPNEDDNFRIPPPGYNPMEHPKAFLCKTHPGCKEFPHIIVPEGLWIPPGNNALWKKMRGMQVEVSIGPNRER